MYSRIIFDFETFQFPNSVCVVLLIKIKAKEKKIFSVKSFEKKVITILGTQNLLPAFLKID